MSYDQDNIFAKILRGEIPNITVYEDDQTLAFMDIMPQMPGHTLVIPKEPAETLFDLSDDAASDLITKVKHVAQAVQKGLKADGITLFQLNGSAAGQTVPHIHFHILPGHFAKATGHANEMANPEELERVAEQIRAGFKRTNT